MQQIKQKHIDIKGCTINTLQGGTPGSKTLVFLHGMAFKAQTWQELGTLQAAVDEGFRVIAIDLPGFGESPAADLSPGEVIMGVLQATTTEQCVLIGPSMGGRVAIGYGIANPSTLLGLVLIGPVGVQENKAQLHMLPESTLILWGENDQVSSPENAKILKENIAGSRVITFAGAGHPCYLEQPDLWHKTLLDFASSL